MEHLYLDAASTEPVGGNVISVMMPFLTEAYANPMSVHSAGKTAARALEAARGSIAADLGARPDDVIFTSGGTEADNLAIKGIAMARHTFAARIVWRAGASAYHCVVDRTSGGVGIGPLDGTLVRLRSGGDSRRPSSAYRFGRVEGRIGSERS